MVLVRPLSEDAILESLQHLERALDEGVATGDAAFGARNASLTQRLFDGCDIMWHIHTPKTGGTSIKASLARGRSFRELQHNGKRPTHFNFLTRGLYLEGFYSDIAEHLTQKRTANVGRVRWYSEEIDLESIVAHRFPFCNRTCFFATVRKPDEWLQSAIDFQVLLSLTPHTTAWYHLGTVPSGPPCIV